MKKVSLFALALILVASVAMAVTLNRAPRIVETDGPVLDPVSRGIVQIPSKTPSENVFTGVHDFSCYMSMVRPLAMDVNFGAAFMFLRASTGQTQLYYVGTVDGGSSWSTQGPLTGSIRYPSAMADVNNEKPVAFYNWGWSSAGEGAYTMWDDGNYNDGLWSAQKNIDTVGRGVAETGIYCVQGAMGTNGVYNVTGNYWGDYTPDGTFKYRSTTYGNTWPVSDPRCVDNLFFYNLFGTIDSLNLYKTNPVRHDPYVEGYINQLSITSSLDGQTVVIFSGGMTPDSITGDFKLFYWKSTDAGATWGPLTVMPLVSDSMLGWGSGIYECTGAIDKEGYVHIATNFYMDTKSPTDSSDYGPLTGIYDQYETSTGFGYTFVSGNVDSSNGISKEAGFCNFAYDPNGDLLLSFSGDANAGTDPCDIYITRSDDNGRSYGSPPLKLTDGTQACWYPHIPVTVGGAGTMIPVFYQVATTAYIHWTPYDLIPTGVEGAPAAKTIHNFALNQNFPNPATSKTTFSFMLPRDSKYSLKVYNIAGQLVKSFVGNGTAGANSLTWNTNNVANGVYMYQLNAAGNTATQRLVIVK